MSCYRCHTGHEWTGLDAIFGQLVFYLCRAADLHPLDERTKPGFFIGWRHEAGMRHRDQLFVADFDDIQERGFRWSTVKSVDRSEIYLPALTFPYADAKRTALLNLEESPEAPARPAAPDGLPWDEEVADAPQPAPRVAMPRFAITLRRWNHFGPTPGCKACEQVCSPGYLHERRCRERFLRLLREAGELPPAPAEDAPSGEPEPVPFYGPEHVLAPAGEDGDIYDAFPDGIDLPDEAPEETEELPYHELIDEEPVVDWHPGHGPPAAAAKAGSSVRVVEYDMREYARSCVEHYLEASGEKKLRKVETPFCNAGSLPHDGDCERGALGSKACSCLMKNLWLARLARPDIMKAVCDLASSVTRWSRNDDRRLHRLSAYIAATADLTLECRVATDTADLELSLYVDADLAGDPLTSKSTSGAYLVLTSPGGTWFPVCWLSKRQTSTSRSTTEAECVALATALFQEALPMLTLFELILGRRMYLRIFEDNQATILICRNGYSPKLRHVSRTHKIDLGSTFEVLQDEWIILEYVKSESQAADPFTKALEPLKWPPALNLLGLKPHREDLDMGAGEQHQAALGGAVAEPTGTGYFCEPCAADLGPCDVLKPPSPDALAVGNLMTCELIDAARDELAEEIGRDAAESIRIHAVASLPKDVAAQLPARRPSGKLPGSRILIELCTSENSALGTVALEYDNVTVVRVTEDMGLLETEATLMQLISEKPGVNIHCSLPCTAWSAWQIINLANGTPEFAEQLGAKRYESRKLIAAAIRLMDAALDAGGHVSYEWPLTCTGWHLKELTTFFQKRQIKGCRVDGCALGFTTSTGEPILKPLWIASSNARLIAALSIYRCRHPADFVHGRVEGKETAPSARYTPALARALLTGYFGFMRRCPAMPCLQDSGEQEHRSSEVKRVDFGATPMSDPIGIFWEALSPDEVKELHRSAAASPLGGLLHIPVPAMVTRLLSRSEMASDPKAIKAVREEADALTGESTWLLDTVTEKDALVADAQASGVKIHLGQLMSICSVKFWERPKDFHKYKGRICFRGDIVRDENGVAAVFEELSASPTAIQGANANIAYGLLPGHKTTTADAVRAYVQSLLRGKHKTWVLIPRELWPEDWHKKGLRKPMCLLNKALYGHPDAGGHWERHLTAAIEKIGGKAISDHPSNFWFAESKLLLTVYVDDLMLSGPAAEHAGFWQKLVGAGIRIDPPEPLTRFLGRHHNFGLAEQ